VNYWIFKVHDEVGGIYGRTGIDIFVHRTSEGFWAIKERSQEGKPEKNLADLAKGDLALFYLVAKTGNRFIGACTVDSSYQQLDAEQAKRLVHREFIDGTQGVYIKDVERWSKPLLANVFFQGNLKLVKRPQDWQAILRQHEDLQ
jgi:hypothetical protein